MTIRYATTDYGFQYGAAEITRIHSDAKAGWVLIAVDTPKTTIQIYVTRTGKLRVIGSGPEWLEWRPAKVGGSIPRRSKPHDR